MSLLSRTKGKTFERRIAAILRQHFPNAVVRRASQADRAHQSDVYVTGGPALLSRLWLECQDARQPTPLRKLEQAERDVQRAFEDGGPSGRLPVVIWHEYGAREIHATMRLWVLESIRNPESQSVCLVVVTMTLNALLAIVADASASQKEAA